MIKIVTPSAFDFDQPVMSLIDVHSKGVDQSWLRKSAAVMTKEMSELKPENGVTFVHLIALGDQESYGLNRNGDGFPKSANEKAHDTFVKHASWYHNHKNKPHLGHPSYGFVKLSAYNPEMHRVELVVGIRDKDDPDSIQKLASGQDIPVSMACVTDPDYPVLTLNGYKPIAQVTTSDRVLSHTGKWRKVKQLNRRKYSGELVTFTMNGLPMPLEVTADHMMFAKVFEGARELEAVKTKAPRYFRDVESFNSKPAGWAHAQHVDIGDRFFYRPITVRSEFGSIDDVALARLLGYYVAEGSLMYNKDRACSVVFTCNMDDMAVRELPVIVSDIAIGSRCIIKPKRNSTAAVEIAVHSTGLGEFVRRLSGTGCKSKQVPVEIFNACTDIKLAYLGAWHEGAGWADKKGIHWSTSSRNLALECRDLLVAAGIPASIYRIDHGECTTSGMPGSGVEYTVNVSWFDADALTKWSNKIADHECSISRGNSSKPPAMRKCPDGLYAYRISGVSTRSVVDIDTYNIEVEEDESYLLAGMISHNCKVPWDECTICKNHAKNADEYCNHIKEAVTQFTEDGRQIGMVNYDPDFFDISKVRKNADRIAFTLRKVAGVHDVILGAELARQWGITEPTELVKDAKLRGRIELLKKLAEIEKEIDGEIRADQNMQNIADSVQDLPCEIGTVPQNEFGGALRELANSRVSLPIEPFFKAAMGPRYSEIEADIPSARAAMSTVFSDALADPTGFLSGVGNYEPVDKGVSNMLKRAVENVARTSSLNAGPVGGRIQLTVLHKKASAHLKAPVTPAGKCLAEEYARYKFAFIEKVQDPFVTKMAILQNFG